MDGNYQHKKEARALGYLFESIKDFNRVETLFEAKDYSWSLFSCQQTNEKLMKSCLAFSGELLTDQHNITDYFNKELISKLKGDVKNRFKSIISNIKDIEWYYIPVRYPVTKEGDVYITEFTEKKCKEVLKITTKFFELCIKFIELKINDNLSKKEGMSIEELKNKGKYIIITDSEKELLKFLKKNYSDVIKEKVD